MSNLYLILVNEFVLFYVLCSFEWEVLCVELVVQKNDCCEIGVVINGQWLYGMIVILVCVLYDYECVLVNFYYVDSMVCMVVIDVVLVM